MIDENYQLQSPYRERWEKELARIEASLYRPGIHLVDTSLISSAAKHGIGNPRSIVQVRVYDDLIGLFSKAMDDSIQIGFTEEVRNELAAHYRKLMGKFEKDHFSEYASARKLRVEQSRELLAIANCLPAERFISAEKPVDRFIAYALEIMARPGVVNDFGHKYGEKTGRKEHAHHDAMIFGKGLAISSDGRSVFIPTRDSDLKNFRNRVKQDKKQGSNLDLIVQDTLRVDYFAPDREALLEYREHHESLRLDNFRASRGI